MYHIRARTAPATCRTVLVVQADSFIAKLHRYRGGCGHHDEPTTLAPRRATFLLKMASRLPEDSVVSVSQVVTTGKGAQGDHVSSPDKDCDVTSGPRSTAWCWNSLDRPSPEQPGAADAVPGLGCTPCRTPTSRNASGVAPNRATPPIDRSFSRQTSSFDSLYGTSTYRTASRSPPGLRGPRRCTTRTTRR